ncbi:MAG: SDR family oxidoreductase [Myxococcales bacterium]|nr:SDR family oxidoreductase [Myxococcales bacterium]
MAKWLITGAGGQLGSVTLRTLQERGEDALGLVSPRGPRPQCGRAISLDLAQPDALRRLLETERPSHVIHAAAVTSPAQAHASPERAWAVNVEAVEVLARASQQLGARLVVLSTDMVFDGLAAPYDEWAETNPRSVYGRTKVAAEDRTLRSAGVVLRSPLLYGLPAAPRPNTLQGQIRALRHGEELVLYHDEYRTPLWLEDAAAIVIEVARSRLKGVVHMAGPQRLSRLAMGRALARVLGVHSPRILSRSCRDAPDPEPRAPDLSLRCERLTRHLGHAPGRTLEQALEQILRQLPASP